MKLKASGFFRFLTAILLISLGMVAQYRYSLIENHLPFLQFKPNSAKTTRVNLANQPQPVDPASVDMSYFWEAWSYLQSDYIKQEEIDPDKMMDGATSGMVSALGDPYTMYLSPDDNQRSGEDLAGTFYGVGIELGYKDNTLAVAAPLPNTPAASAGIQAGDLILRVKDQSRDFDEETTGWSLQKAVNEIRGPKDSIVTLTLYRDNNGQEPFDVDVKRGEILVNSVELEFVEGNGKKFAHLKLIRFGERTMIEWNNAIAQILAQKADLTGIMLDLRNDPGGLFDVAIDVASDFVEDGVVVTQKGKFASKEYQARGQARLAGIPVVVLVNKGSASASEIVAGALRDQLSAKLIGSQTFGKGTVQDRRELSNGGGLHVTIARWLLPGGDWINDEGIPVDVEVDDNPDTETDEVVIKAEEVLGQL